ncbi:MAG: AmmeMemoRadiSam system protein B [Candidatus Gygaella obscura]|nr:AmmeMemoRadiSam system protein B [Candidatus Gygaella obscura]
MVTGKLKIVFFLIVGLFLSTCLYAESTGLKNAVFAGRFYPKHPKKLRSMIEEKLDKSGLLALGQRIYALITPHASYSCSGDVAAVGFNQIKNKKIDSIILLGPSHHFGFKGLVVGSWAYFDAVLDKVEVDNCLKDKLKAELPFLQENNDFFINEHSLEVQLPFLKQVLGSAKVLPILTGIVSVSEIRELASVLKDVVLHSNTLVIASSDLSHYYDYDYCSSLDQNTLSTIVSLDIESLEKSVLDKSVQLCGYAAVAVVMEMSRLLNLESKILKYSNSGETCSNKKSVVGYSSVAFYYDEKLKENKMFEVFQKKRLLEIARKTLIEFLKSGNSIALDDTDPALLAERGVFVTLHKAGSLRGCIGNIYPRGKLNKTVQDMAISAATQDPRFSPVKREELGDIDIEISVLTVPKRVNSIDEIVLGRHGVIVEKGFNKGVFLPQVAEETGWTKEEFLSYLCQHKAGLAKDAWKDPLVKMYTFEAVVFSERGMKDD